MSVQVPPTNTTTPVYNPIFYIDPTASSGIDVAFLDANYLKFPTAQGSEDFTNGLFSTDTIDFNSSTGANRAITNVSKTEFSDILGNTLYTASIEENSTAIGIYDGGLIINSSNSINLVGTNILANGVPVGTGGGNVSTTTNNTFQLGFTQTFDGAISIDNLQSNIGQLSSNNTGLGGGVFSNLTSGVDNSIFGYHSALALTTGGQNVSIGKSSLVSLTTGQGNTAVGWGSMGTLVSSNYNTAIGNLSAYSLTSGTQNTSIGYQTGGYMTTGSNNVSIGYLSGVSPSAPTLSDTIAIGNQAYSSATGDIILGNSVNYNSTGFPYYAKFTPNTTFQGVQLQGAYNNSGNFTIETNGNSVALNGTFVDLNGTGSGAIGGVNVSNGMNVNTGVIQTTDKASNPTFQSLYSCYYSLSGVPYFGYNSAGTYTYSQLATTSSLYNPVATLTSGLAYASGSGTGWTITAPAPQLTNVPPLYGRTFNYIVSTTNIPPLTISSSGQMVLPSGYGIATGTGLAQAYSTGTSAPNFYGYILSTTISNIGVNLNYDKTTNPNGNDFAFYFVSSVPYVSGSSLGTITLKIYPIQTTYP